MRVLVTGSHGMVARAAIDHCQSQGDEVIGLSRADLDIADPVAVSESLRRHYPNVVMNCAAYTNVDGAETNVDASYAANAIGPENLAAECLRSSIKFITISTDYVFGGEHDRFYDEDSETLPLGVYAKSKLEGEERSRAANPDTLVVRSGWIFGPGGSNFLSVMPDLLRQGKRLTAVSDSLGTPTYALDLVARMRELAIKEAKGIVHVPNSGEGTTYYGYGQKVCEKLGIDPETLSPVTDADLKRPAQRPANSKLRSIREEPLGLMPLPHWENALERFLKIK
jgi:dTDP-4-dehydrorhamnose reductase